jgi:non-specific serine/threonine protein kinase
VGKTRLAIELATIVQPEFDEGVVFVDLTPVSDAGLVLAAVAATLGVIEDPGHPLIHTLNEHLRGRNLLLVLDNFEQVVAAGSDVASLLAAGADVKLLLTSREPVHVSWEHAYSLGPLPVPEPLASDRHSLVRFPATALFIERARAAEAGFSPDARSGPAITEICRRLDGLPLAIELAAAWTRALRPEDILQRLQHREGLPGEGPPDAPERHRTLTHAIRWSYGLLPPRERAVFRRLGVFSGGCSMEVLEHVCAGLHSDILAPVASLVDKSLLVRVDAGETRFRLLEPIREFALEELRGAGEAEEVHGRHAAWFLNLTERAYRMVWSQHQEEWLARLDREHDNIRAALQWSLGGGDEETGVRLAGSVHRYWFVRGHFREAEQWLRLAASKAHVSDRARAAALVGLGAHLYAQGWSEQALEAAEKSVTIARTLDDSYMLAAALHTAGLAAFAKGDLPYAEQLYAEMLLAARSAGDEWMAARALTNLGVLLFERGEREAGKRAVEEALLLARPLRDRWLISTVTAGLGRVLASDDPERAAALFKESLTLAYETRHRWRIARLLENFASLLARSDREDDAVLLLGAAQRLREAIGTLRRPSVQSWVDAAAAPVRERLGRARFEAALDRGKTMTLEEAVTLALGRPASAGQPRVARPGGLTGREVQIALAIARGLTNRAIGDDLKISERTVDAHVQNILNKLGMSRRTQLAGWATTHLSSGTVS